jgi:tetratricopeptide (TPR) repeat protein
VKQKLIVHFSCAIVCILAAGSVLAQPADEFAKATQDYSAGRFPDAINGYEALVKSGQWSANLFYDLGNAYFRTGDLGKAILSYERALALERHHAEADANLRIARDQARALVLAAGPVERSLRFASVNEFAIAAAIAFWTAAFAIVALVFTRRRAPGTIALSILSVSIFAAGVFSAYLLENGPKGKALAIVIGQEVEARLATADNASSVLALPPGSEIQILSTRGDWIYAGLPNNLRGWIPAKNAEAVQL